MALPPHLAQEAVKLETDYMRQMGLYKDVSAEWVAERGLRPVGAIPLCQQGRRQESGHSCTPRS